MSNQVKRVLVVATSRKTRGGITAVLKAHERMDYWRKYHCHWVQTHRDGPAWRKIAYFVAGMVDFVIRLPFYDTVHIHTADSGTEKRKRIFAWISKHVGKKLIVQLHSSGEEYSIGKKYGSLYQYSFNAADRIVLLSKGWQALSEKIFPNIKNKTYVLYNPCPIVHLDLSTSREKTVLFAGTLTKRKGYADLIQAFAKVADKIPGWRLVLAGNGEVEQGKALAQQMGVADRVEFLGWVSGSKKDKAFRQASVYCLPSYSEGFPMGVLDAWAYGLPVITTPVGGIPDVAIDGENILLFEPGDVVTLANQILRVAIDDKLYEKLKNKSINFATNQFNITTISQDVDILYSSI
jgi:glycosyltransferase involved in cell wall biosynthesis